MAATKWTHVQLTGVTISVKITNSMFTVVRYVTLKTFIVINKEIETSDFITNIVKSLNGSNK